CGPSLGPAPAAGALPSPVTWSPRRHCVPCGGDESPRHPQSNQACLSEHIYSIAVDVMFWILTRLLRFFRYPHLLPINGFASSAITANTTSCFTAIKSPCASLGAEDIEGPAVECVSHAPISVRTASVWL